MNEKLEKALNQLVETEAVCNQDLTGWDPSTKMGMETRKRQAKNDLDVLKNAYKNELINSAIKVFVTGDTVKAKRFVESLDGGSVVVVAGDGVYRKMAKNVEKTLDDRSRHFNTSQLVHLIDELHDFARDFELRDIPLPKMDGNDINTQAPTLEDVVDLVRKAIRATANDDINRIYLEREVLNKAVAVKAAGNVVPVIIHSLTQDEIGGLSQNLFFGRPNLVLDLSDIADDENLVANATKKIAELYNQSKK